MAPPRQTSCNFTPSKVFSAIVVKTLRGKIRPIAVAAALAAVFALGASAAPPAAQGQSNNPGFVTELWDQWTGANAPWPRQISQDDNDYACLEWLQLNETGENNPDNQASASYFGPAGGTAPTVATPPGQIYTLTNGSAVAEPQGSSPPADWNGQPPLNFTAPQFVGGSTSYQPPTQLFCTSTVALEDPGWFTDDRAQLTGNCVAPNIVGGQSPPSGSVPYVWSSQANGPGSSSFYSEMATNPSTQQAVNTAVEQGLIADAGQKGTWALLENVLEGEGISALASGQALAVLGIAVNEALGSLFANDSQWFTSTAWSIESTNDLDASWFTTGPPGTESTPPSQIAVGAVDDWGTGGASVAMGYQCSASPSPVGEPLNFVESVLNGETTLSSARAAAKGAKPRGNGKEVPLKEKSNDWLYIPAMYSTASNAGAKATTAKTGQIVTPGDRDDRITGRGGPDRIAGGKGNDRISGGGGNDALYGGGDSRDGGLDSVSGGPGNDLIATYDASSRPSTNDRISCGSGIDVVQGDRGDKVSRDCEYVFLGAKKVRAVRNLYKRSSSKRDALRTLARLARPNYAG